MTGIIVAGDRLVPALTGAIATDLEPAFSPVTKRIAKYLSDLRKSSPTVQAPAAGSAKDLSERLFDAVAGAKILTAEVAMHLDENHRQNLFRQLDSMHEVAEWEEGDEPLQQSSFATFLKAMLAINAKRLPGLGLSQSGHLIGAWTTGRDRLTIEFLANGWVRWVLARYRDDEPDRFAGQTPVSRLAQGLAAHQPEHWFS